MSIFEASLDKTEKVEGVITDIRRGHYGYYAGTQRLVTIKTSSGPAYISLPDDIFFCISEDDLCKGAGIIAHLITDECLHSEILGKGSVENMPMECDTSVSFGEAKYIKYFLCFKITIPGDD